MSTENVKEKYEQEEVVQNAEKNESADQVSESPSEEMEQEHADTPNQEQEVTSVSIDELQLKLQEAENKANENYQKYLRAQADFDNFRRRTRTEKEEQAKYASFAVIEKLLPAIDNFGRALEASKTAQDPESLAKGVEMVFKQLEQALTEEGLEVIPTVGQPFDPTIHQAVMQVESDEYESGTVVEELQKGYKLKDKVIRPAMVKVAM